MPAPQRMPSSAISRRLHAFWHEADADALGRVTGSTTGVEGTADVQPSRLAVGVERLPVMQVAETVAAMSEEKIKTYVALWAFIVANVALACFTGHFFLKQLALGH